jgi:hypothetical protein
VVDGRGDEGDDPDAPGLLSLGNVNEKEAREF